MTAGTSDALAEARLWRKKAEVWCAGALTECDPWTADLLREMACDAETVALDIEFAMRQADPETPKPDEPEPTGVV
ncbi:MAG TPA: hypothetical protein VHT74_25155 [Acetobacteraceae bacterium]|nr:hypothetical protein [Acetobacteraceae bacterium]